MNKTFSKYRHEASQRGPLTKTWLTELRQMCKNIQQSRELKIDAPTQQPPVHMTCYKLVSAKFKWFGLQNRVEKYIHTAEKRIFTLFHRQVFCWMGAHGESSGWYGMTMEDIRRIEAETKRKLDEERSKGEKRGHGQAIEEK